MYQARDPELGDNAVGEGPFGEKAVRQAFIRKVYAILAVQLAVTFGHCLLGLNVPAVRAVMMHPGVLIAALAIQISLLFILCCCVDVLRKVPINYVILFVYTIAMAITVTCVCLQSKQEAVAIAAGLTFFATLAVSAFSFWTKFDFTKYIYVFLILGLVLMVAGLVAMFLPGRTIQIVYAAFGAILMMGYLALDTQMILGDRELSISEEDYILASLKLYIDIINLFLYLLKLINELNRD